MRYQFIFDRFHRYDSGKSGITVPVKLSINDSYTDIETKLDTGASHCIFQRAHGESLGFNNESGYRITINVPGGQFTAYGHDVTLSVLGFELDAMVYFAEDDSFRRDVLGRQGFFNRVNIAIFDYQGELYLSRNDS